jgi:Creatinase/Prolidase N-terminal domain
MATGRAGPCGESDGSASLAHINRTTCRCRFERLTLRESTRGFRGSDGGHGPHETRRAPLLGGEPDGVEGDGLMAKRAEGRHTERPRARREGRARVDRAQAAMGDAGLDGLLLLNSTNLVYLSGYPAVERTLARPHYLLVPRQGSPVFRVHEGRAAEARKYGWRTRRR